MLSLSVFAILSVLISRTTSGSQNLALYYKDKIFNLKTADIDFSYGFNEKIKNGKVFPRMDNIIITDFDDPKLEKFLLTIDAKINKSALDAKFEFQGGKIREFQLSQTGLAVNNTELKKEIVDAFVNQSKKLEIPVDVTKPKIKTEDINNLGIKELMGTGNSTFFHSIPSRVYNVTLAASRINGTVVAPGAIFSFNNALGDVSQFTGYKQAYIISEGKTILGDGGGVCQVSTTLFRALLNAGLPVVERAAHAYRVGYYEQNSPPGLDATVFGPSPDLKFVNNTPGHILIQAKLDPKHYSIVFELYGTSDGRVATISKPLVTKVTDALPTVYQDDPTLPAGTTKQVDFSAKGATVTFNYLVTRNGETVFKKTFISNYRPWAAVYLRGTGI